MKKKKSYKGWKMTPAQKKDISDRMKAAWKRRKQLELDATPIEVAAPEPEFDVLVVRMGQVDLGFVKNGNLLIRCNVTVVEF